MYVILWQFDVEPAHTAEFERIYGSAGRSAEFFRRSPDYRGTHLLYDTEVPYRYVTFDHWTSKEAFQKFEREHAEEYQSLDANFAAFSRHEKHLGTFVTSEGEGKGREVPEPAQNR